MQNEISKTPGTGRLIIAANALGNPKDIPTRSLEALRTAELLIFEEDRIARQTLKAAGIHRDYLRFSEHHEAPTLTALETALKKGSTAVYMSDQGMPGVADPGQELLKIAYRVQARIEVIPGPSSITAALGACPFLGRGFTFAGFLPRDGEEREAALRTLSKNSQATVLLDTPYRLQALLDACVRILGKDRQALVALDISGESEDYWLDSLGRLAQRASSLATKLNFVLVISGLR